MPEREVPSLVEIAKNICDERRVLVRTYFANAYKYRNTDFKYGMLNGQDIFQIIFELSGARKEDLMAKIQWRLRNSILDPFQLVAISSTFEWPHEFKDGLADAVSRWEPEERHFMLRDLEQETLDSSILLSRRLRDYDTLLRVAFEAEEPLDRVLRPSVDLKNSDIAEKLISGIETKWQGIFEQAEKLTDEERQNDWESLVRAAKRVDRFVGVLKKRYGRETA